MIGRSPKPMAWVRDGDCMICTSHACSGSGYPRIYRGKQRWNISRLILFKRHQGNIEGMVARHTCDRRNCINPGHIVIGTVGDNNRDTVAHGRQRFGGTVRDLAGKTKPWAKLTEAQVVEIRALLKTSTPRHVICARFGINRNSLYKLSSGQSWKHVQK